MQNSLLALGVFLVTSIGHAATPASSDVLKGYRAAMMHALSSQGLLDTLAASGDGTGGIFDGKQLVQATISASEIAGGFDYAFAGIYRGSFHPACGTEATIEAKFVGVQTGVGLLFSAPSYLSGCLQSGTALSAHQGQGHRHAALFLLGHDILLQELAKSGDGTGGMLDGKQLVALTISSAVDDHGIISFDVGLEFQGAADRYCGTRVMGFSRFDGQRDGVGGWIFSDPSLVTGCRQ